MPLRRRAHAVPTVLYAKLVAECDQHVTIVSQRLTVLGVDNNGPTTIACLSHSATLNVPWPNFLSPDSGTKFQKEVGLGLPLFFRYN